MYDWTYVVASAEAWPLDAPYITGTQDETDPSYALLKTVIKGRG